jgi:hypothetical protein
MLLRSTLKTKYMDQSVDAHIRVSANGLSFSSDKLGQGFGFYALTPDFMRNAISMSSGRRVSVAVSGSFVGSHTVYGGVDVRERMPPSYPLVRAGIFLEAKDHGIRFELSGESSADLGKFELTFEVPDGDLASVLSGCDTGQAEAILLAKTALLKCKPLLTGASDA